jgi:hypothetical protein
MSKHPGKTVWIAVLVDEANGRVIGAAGAADTSAKTMKKPRGDAKDAFAVAIAPTAGQRVYLVEAPEGVAALGARDKARFFLTQRVIEHGDGAHLVPCAASN